jgi:nucleotidyltransferase substrate binding protein (TIGR01987 family)
MSIENTDSNKIKYNLEILEKAYKMLESFITHKSSEQEQAGIIKSFEFCYELSWKIMKRILSEKGVDVSSPKDVFREAAKNKLINNPKPWFEFLKKRNRTVRTYNLEIVKDVMEVIDEFKIEVRDLINSIKETSI